MLPHKNDFPPGPQHETNDVTSWDNAAVLVSSTIGRVVIAADLVLDAAMVPNPDDGPNATARRWPSDDTRLVDCAAGHRLAEHSGKTVEEGRLAVAGEVPPLPRVRTHARGRLQPCLEASGVPAAVEFDHVDVDLEFRAVPRGVDDERAARAAAVGPSRSHA